MKKILLLLMTAFLVAPAFCQDKNTQAQEDKKSKKEARKLRISAIAKQEEEGVIKYHKHTVFGLKLTTDGYGGFLEVARAQSIRKALLFQLEITEKKHQKEYKQQIYQNTNPVIYGKRNFFYPVKLGVQQQYLLGNKGNKNGVAISANGGGGLIAGLLRPYLVEVEKQGARTFVGYDANDTASYFLKAETHIGGPGLGKGWSNLTVTPGAYLKSAVRFDFGKYNEMVNAVEVGLYGEFYSKKIPQMVQNKEKNFFFSAFVSIMFGKRK